MERPTECDEDFAYCQDIADAVFAKLSDLEYDAPGAPWRAHAEEAASRNDGTGLVEALCEAAIHHHEGGERHG